MTTKAKTEKKQAVTKKAVTKKFKTADKVKTGLLSLLVLIVTIGAIVASEFVEQPQSKTQIDTPIISRTEISKKPAIDIKLFDEEEKAELNQEETVIEEPIDETLKAKEVEVAPANNLESVIKHLTDLELAQTDLKTEIATLKEFNSVEKISSIEAKLAKIESLNGNIGNLAKIFLSQQLVLLDNAFKVGGNQNIAIQNIYNFATNVAKDQKVALKLKELLTLTEEQAIITPQALLFYANKLEDIKLNLTEKTDELAENASFIEKIKHLLQSFIIVRNKDEMSAEETLWKNTITKLQESIIFTDFVTVEEILNNDKIATLGGKDFANFKSLFTTYIKQQQALQATLGAFIEGYNYDY